MVNEVNYIEEVWNELFLSGVSQRAYTGRSLAMEELPEQAKGSASASLVLFRWFGEVVAFVAPIADLIDGDRRHMTIGVKVIRYCSLVSIQCYLRRHTLPDGTSRRIVSSEVEFAEPAMAIDML